MLRKAKEESEAKLALMKQAALAEAKIMNEEAHKIQEAEKAIVEQETAETLVTETIKAVQAIVKEEQEVLLQAESSEKEEVEAIAKLEATSAELAEEQTVERAAESEVKETQADLKKNKRI